MGQRWIVTIGDQNVSDVVRDLNVKQVLNGQPSAEFRMDLARVSRLPLDYTAIVVVSRIGALPPNGHDLSWRPTGSGEGEQLLFAGRIDAVRISSGLAHVSCHGGFLGLQDSTVGLLEVDLDPLEHAVLLTHIAGIPRSSVNITGLEEQRPTAYEVVAPVDGVRTSKSQLVGGVAFEAPVMPSALEGTQVTPRLAEYFSSAHTTARLRIDAATALDAELQGLHQIDMCLAWITAQACDARATISGMPATFQRSDTLARPRRRDIVWVHSLTGRGGYVRSPNSRTRSSVLSLEPGSVALRIPAPSVLGAAQASALSALERAQSATDNSTTILALWEAVEFLVCETPMPELFKPAHGRALRRALKNGPSLTPEQRARVEDLLAGLNQAPLFAKLRRYAETISVPVTEAEFSLLHVLRKYRNDALHGRRPERVDPEQLRHGISVVARLIVSGIAGQQAEVTDLELLGQDGGPNG